MTGPLDVNRIMELIPHRYPLLLVDRILSYEQQHRILGQKNVSINEPFFQGHFPGYPILPGVLIIEAMAQVGVVFVMLTVPDPSQILLFFRRINRAKFRKPVIPGDILILDLVLLKQRDTIFKFEGKALVKDEIVATAELEATLVPRQL
ncbi:3-hydroxyacyl-ACP dehydratase FabZ [bacterium]|nr:3-hydroxyacyl-ACP dehydratase FabZ [bacterium]